MRANKLRQIHSEGRLIVNGWMSSASSYMAEVMGHSGFDSVVVDMQHGMIGYEGALAMLQAISATPAVPMARVAANDPALVMQLVDSGAYGVICPLVTSAEDVRRFVSACRYPPQGSRSFGPARGLLYGGPDYFERANEEVLTFALIETAAALASLPDILAVPGLDGLYVGPNDLALSMGFPPKLEPDHPEVLAAMERIARLAGEAGKIVGTHIISAEATAQRLGEGYSMLTPGSDVTFASRAAQDAVKRLRGTGS
jgi:4-hydroxy-2-oxoheptanedioate aldolase